MIKRIIFDIDETITNSNFDGFNSYNKYLQKNPHFTFTATELYQSFDYVFDGRFTGLNEEFVKHMKETLDERIEMADILEMFEFYKNEATLLDSKTPYILGELSKHFEIVVLSSWFLDIQLKRLEKLDILQYFDQVYAIENAGVKPSEECYIKAMSGLKPEECLMVGDSFTNDYKKPREMGMLSVHLTNEEGLEHHTIKELGELLDILEV